MTHLDIELTERCNNACQHCYINLPLDDERAKGSELTTDEWKNILKQAAELGAMSVRFTGGEPLIRDDFEELYVFTRRLGIQVMLFTNARRITRHLAGVFKKLPPGKLIEISVYGMKPETYDKVACAQGAFTEFWQGVNALREANVPFYVKGAFLPDNISDINTFEAWAKSLPWMERAPNYAVYFDLRARRDSPARNRLIQELRPEPKSVLNWLEQRGEEIVSDYKDDLRQFCSKFTSPQGNQLFTCSAGSAGSVDAYGKYQPCLPLRSPELCYDLRQGTIRDALENFFPPISDLTASNPEYLERCARCFLKGLCEQCPAKSWAEHGTLDTPVEYFCQVAHTQARYLGLLNDDEKAWQITDWEDRINKIKNEIGE